MDPKRFALIGCGRIGNRHLEHIVNVGELVAVCDINEEKVKAAGEKYGCKTYTSLESFLLADEVVDIVSICTPNGLHASQSVAALKAGYHVVCEKPMALSSSDCRTMIEEAETADRKLFIIKQNRYNPPIQALRQLLQEGKLGKIHGLQLNCFWNRNSDYYAGSWKGTLAMDGGTLYTQFSHFIDLMYWMGGDVSEVDAYCGNLNHQGIIEFEDTGVVILKFSSGALGSIHYTVNAFGKNMEGSLTIFGEKGTVKVGGEYLNELEYQMIESGAVKDIPMGNKPNDYGTYKGSMSNHNLVYQNVIDVLHGKAAITTQACEAMKTIEIIEMIYSAAAINKRS